jgi:hypothetical protein
MICAAWNAAQIVLRPLGTEDLRSEERESRKILRRTNTKKENDRSEPGRENIKKRNQENKSTKIEPLLSSC